MGDVAPQLQDMGLKPELVLHAFSLFGFLLKSGVQQINHEQLLKMAFF